MLDGAILVLCAVGGVQSQSMTVDRQMKRYHVPRLAFINKMDRIGANPHRVIQQVKEKLECDAILMQLPIGKEDDFAGVVDLITMQAIYFDGNNGEKVRREAIPADMLEDAKKYRHAMLESLSMYSDELMELLLGETEVPEELIHATVKDAVQNQDATAVFMGSAYKNKGVQPLLDAIVRYLPSPLAHVISAKKWDNPEEKLPLAADPSKPFVGMAFKLVDDPYGQLTFMRIYQGTVKKGDKWSTNAPANANVLAVSSACMPTSAKKWTAPAPATSWPLSASMPRAATPTLRNTSSARWKTCLLPSPSSKWRSRCLTVIGR